MQLADAERMARQQMALHGLHDWRFRFDKATRRFGCCDHTRHTISLSRQIVVLNEPDRVRETLLHEIAHALAGPCAGHGKVWRETAVRIGGDARRCYGVEVSIPAKPGRGRPRRPSPDRTPIPVPSS